MDSDIKLFFDKFAEDFSALSGNLISGRYESPYTSISSKGDLSVYKTDADIAAFFNRVIDEYVEQGVRNCKYDNLEYLSLNSNTCLASLNWHMLNSTGGIIISWRESYILLLSNGIFKIVTSIDH